MSLNLPDYFQFSDYQGFAIDIYPWTDAPVVKAGKRISLTATCAERFVPYTYVRTEGNTQIPREVQQRNKCSDLCNQIFFSIFTKLKHNNSHKMFN